MIDPFLTSLCLLSFAVRTSRPSEDASHLPEPEQDSPAAIREGIIKAYEKWGTARVEMDKETLRSMLTDDFKVTIKGKDYTTEQFMGMIGDPDDETRRMKRFDVTVLSVQKADTDWSAVIEEKIELDIRGSDGKWIRVYSLWVTRDSFCRVGDGLKIKSSEAIGWEQWNDKTPPFGDW